MYKEYVYKNQLSPDLQQQKNDIQLKSYCILNGNGKPIQKFIYHNYQLAWTCLVLNSKPRKK